MDGGTGGSCATGLDGGAGGSCVTGLDRGAGGLWVTTADTDWGVRGLGMVVQLGLFCHLVSALKERMTRLVHIYLKVILHVMSVLAFR